MIIRSPLKAMRSFGLPEDRSMQHAHIFPPEGKGPGRNTQVMYQSFCRSHCTEN